jgi:hypothetical protein
VTTDLPSNAVTGEPFETLTGVLVGDVDDEVPGRAYISELRQRADGSVEPYRWPEPGDGNDVTLFGVGVLLDQPTRWREVFPLPSEPEARYPQADGCSPVIFIPGGVEVGAVAEALASRARAWEGKDEDTDRFASRILCLRQGPRWREAVSTALLGGWIDPLKARGRLTPEDVWGLRREAMSIHRQLVPLWRRRAGHSRVALLDTPLGEDLTLHDMVTGSPDPQDSALGAEPDDPRLAALLRALDPDERRVVLAWAHPAVATWADAAWEAGAADPVTVGERVRRKVKRQAREHERRRAQSGL